jgi:small subunit ribosomal protein S4
MIRKPYAPGPKSTKRRHSVSEYGKELNEKQKLRNWYNLEERQFKNYVKKILKAGGKVKDAAALLVSTLESRFDNTVFRLGFCVSRATARKLIIQGHFLVNGKSNNIPSRLLRKGDKISIKEKSITKGPFKDLQANLKKYNPPSWMKLDADKLEGEMVGEPNIEEAAPPSEISTIFEFYSR